VDDVIYLDLADAVAYMRGSEVVSYTADQIIDKMSEVLFRLENDDQIKLFIELVKSYKIINEYSGCCLEIIKRIEKNFGRNDNIVLIPVRDENSEIKSGHSVVYEIRAYIDPNQFKSVKFLESLDSIKDDINNYQIIAVDDFIGTGSQFRKFSREIQRKFDLSISRIHLFAIAVMKSRVDRIKKFCSLFESVVLLEKSIEKISKDQMIENAYEIYDSIESNLSISPYYRRGYGRSESLVTMKRTPNNTLPIFWNVKAKGGKRWPAPFPRF